MINLEEYKQELIEDELAPSTIKQYISTLRQLNKFLEVNNYRLDKKGLIEYKDLLEAKYKPNTINTKIIIVNKYLEDIGQAELQLKQIRVQNNHNLDTVLSENDYSRILRQAEQKGTSRDYVMLQAFYYTGLRVSELEFLTVEALRKGYIVVNNKGKIRRVPIANRLKKILNDYIQEEGIDQGSIIRNREGEALSRSYVFKRVKYLAGQARVKKSKAYPHSIRHLFAKQWLKSNGNNYLQLADILGHSSLETTRIYSRMNIDEARKTIDF